MTLRSVNVIVRNMEVMSTNDAKIVLGRARTMMLILCWFSYVPRVKQLTGGGRGEAGLMKTLSVVTSNFASFPLYHVGHVSTEVKTCGFQQTHLLRTLLLPCSKKPCLSG